MEPNGGPFGAVDLFVRRVITQGVPTTKDCKPQYKTSKGGLILRDRHIMNYMMQNTKGHEGSTFMALCVLCVSATSTSVGAIGHSRLAPAPSSFDPGCGLLLFHG